MCGIVAQYPGGPSLVEPMLARLLHRGPDGSGTSAVAGGYLGHTRLAIVDVEGGDQPLWDPPSGACLVGNAEIYNYRALAGGLPPGSLRTGSDNEVALQVLLRHGPAGLAELRGIFSLAMLHPTTGPLVVRDPLGIKPLYWAQRDGTFLFASEMRAFDADWRAHVEVFPPGHYWSPASGLAAYDHPLGPLRAFGYEQCRPWRATEASPALRRAVTEAVRRELVADVEVGVLLSGGVDSSIVAGVAAEAYRERGERLKTFAVGTADSEDLAAARRVAGHLGTDHHERVYRPEEAVELLDRVVDVLESFDPPLVRSAVSNYLVAQLAAERVKVVLTGEGADEIFGGYRYMHEERDPERFHAELVRTLRELHTTNLQRCDRTGMAHGLEARVPMLDAEVVATALSIPPELKIATGDRPEKALLREAFTGVLPDDILWRRKSEFHQGSGCTPVLRAAAERLADGLEPADVDPPLRTAEEAYYYELFRASHGSIRPERVLERSIVP